MHNASKVAYEARPTVGVMSCQMDRMDFIFIEELLATKKLTNGRE